jgi:hypothetical protein
MFSWSQKKFKSFRWIYKDFRIGNEMKHFSNLDDFVFIQQGFASPGMPVGPVILMIELALQFILFPFGTNPISWSYKKQKRVTTETTLAALIALWF